MTRFSLNKKCVAAVLAAFVFAPALVQTAVAPAKPASAVPAAAATVLPSIAGKTIDGAPFKLNALKGKMVLVMFWSTGCAVCRDKMPELRNNYAGWAGKPFELVAISTDKRVQDLLDYKRIITRTVSMKERFVQMWTGESGYKDNLGKHAMLPAAYLLGKTGKVVEHYCGPHTPRSLGQVC